MYLVINYSHAQPRAASSREQDFTNDFCKLKRHELGVNVQIDFFFHHGNITIFESIMDMVKEKYGMYVISPIPTPEPNICWMLAPE